MKDIKNSDVTALFRGTIRRRGGVDMKELVNLSNISCDIQQLLGGDMGKLRQLLNNNGLHGIELMIYGPWDGVTPPADLVDGVHLRFWSDWLSFFLGDTKALMKAFGTQKAVREYYEADSLESWLDIWRKNICQAAEAKAEYAVFHVSQAHSFELRKRTFQYSDEDVVTASIELANEICKQLPDTCTLLFENLFWPGLTLRHLELAERLLSEIHHPNCGFMLDTGHLMNTELSLRSQEEAVDFVLQTIDNLGEMASFIKGIHLHQSLSGEFVQEQLSADAGRPMDWLESFQYVKQVDRHQPFSSYAGRKIVDRVQPDYLVHEFIPEDFSDWERKIQLQRSSLRL